jgi:hypothetical protein
MPTVAPDILTSLLGVTPANGAGPGGPLSALGVFDTAEGSLIFSDILGLLSNVGMSPDTTGNQTPGNQVSGDDPFNTLVTKKLSGLTDPVWMLGRPEAVAGQPFTNIIGISTPDTTAGKLPNPGVQEILGATINPEIKAEALPNPGGREISQAATESTLTGTDVLFAVKSPGPNLQRALLSEPIQLTAGTYQVVAAKVSNGTVDLTVQAPDSQVPIQISLPLEQLMSGNAPSMSKSSGSAVAGTPRVSLTQPTSSSLDLSAWFTKLNISELRVENINPTPDTKIAASVKLTLVDTGDVTAPQIEAIVPSTDIRAFRVVNRSGRIMDSNGTPDSLSPRADGARPALSGPAVSSPLSREPFVIPKTIVKAAVVDDQSGMPSFGDANETSKSIDGNVAAQTAQFKTDQSSASGEKIQFSSVRFTLPDKIDQALVPNGKSLSLQIHPEHLGPARLSLHWGTDGLTARVTVDSPLAQSAIERSLDRLQDQLVRAGVKVDSLEVALSGGHTRGQFMHQQPQWQRPQTANPLFMNEYRSPEFAAVVAPVQAQPEYVGSRGVNLFA